MYYYEIVKNDKMDCNEIVERCKMEILSKWWGNLNCRILWYKFFFEIIFFWGKWRIGFYLGLKVFKEMIFEFIVDSVEGIYWGDKKFLFRVKIFSLWRIIKCIM